MEMEDSVKHHVVLFPFMARGHIAPFLALADLLSRRHPGLIVTVVSTPLNIQNISSFFPAPSISSIRLRSLPFSPATHGLPSDCTDNFATVPNQHKVSFVLATKSLLPAFDQLIVDITQEDGRPPLCVITDFLLAWTVDVAHRYGVFHSQFITCSAYGMVVFSSLWKHLPHHRTNSDEFPLPDFPEVVVHRSQLEPIALISDGTDRWSVYLQEQLSLWLKTDAMIVNTVEEMEATGLRMLRKLLPSAVWPIGPLLTSSPSKDVASKDPIVDWLDLQPPASVLYICFGSQNGITAPQMMELATGLEASGARFVWAIRAPYGSDEEFKAEWLPEKFEERMRENGRGVLVHGWAPQMEILSHAATGAFLSHCGWNSTLESLILGVPILAWPLSADQPHNAKILEEMGVCVEVARGNKMSSKADRKEVERVAREVLGGGEMAKEMRKRVEEVGRLMEAAWRDEQGSSFRGLTNFFRAAVRYQLHEKEPQVEV